MTVESLRGDQRQPGRVIRAFRLPGQDASRVEIIENIAPHTEAETEEFVIKKDGETQLVMGLQPTPRFGTYLGIAPLEAGTEISAELLRVSAESLLAAQGLDQAIVPPEARGVEEDVISGFGDRDRTFGFFTIQAVEHPELAITA